MILVKLNDNITIENSISYNNSKDILNDRPLRHSPPLFGKTSLTFSKKTFKTQLNKNVFVMQRVGWGRRPNISIPIDAVWSVYLEIRGFGTYKIVKRKARVGRNPKNSEIVQIPEKKAIKWKISKDFSKESKIKLTISENVKKLTDLSISNGFGDEDTSAIFKIYQQMNVKNSSWKI